MLTFHEISDLEMSFHDADPKRGGEIGFDLPPAVIQMMVGKVLHIHVNDPDGEMLEKSVHAFQMDAYPTEYPHHAQKLILKPAHHLAGIKCQTWLHVSDLETPYIGVSGYCPSELAQVAAGLSWSEGFKDHLQWMLKHKPA
jgi:hypothetical protein